VLEIDVDIGRLARSDERNRSNRRFDRAGSTAVIPSTKQTALLAALPLP
jgi:hypothetical protein